MDEKGLIYLKDYDIFTRNMQTLKETSKDDHEKDPSTYVYMTNSLIKAVNFDTVKEEYSQSLNLGKGATASVDALLQDKDRIVFIEFKNRPIDGPVKRNVRNKVSESILIFLNLVKRDVSYVHKNIDFILVYSEKKSATNNNGNKLEKEELQFSAMKIAFKKALFKKSNTGSILFGMSKYKNLYFREVYTYNEREFDNYLSHIK